MISKYSSLPDASRVWIYQADSAFNTTSSAIAKTDLLSFLNDWAAHSRGLLCYGDILHNRFLIIIVDESSIPASGCSIDSSVRFIEALGAKYNKDFFDRMHYAFKKNEKIHIIHHHKLSEAYKKEEIGDDTLFFDNLVSTKSDFENHWLKPLKDSWHNRFI